MQTLIISDLHLGNGGPYDVFEGGTALPALLDRMRGAPLSVLVNGDGVDFLMNEDPLELDLGRALSQAQAIVRAPRSATVLRAFGRVLARGGEVQIRLGNHDVELAFPDVQDVFREALAQPDHIAARLAFATGEAPAILEIGGARVVVTHGEQNDRWNTVDYAKLLQQDRSYKYAPGSVLVKEILNPGTSAHGMRFLSLLKPDFQGAALSALAVDPAVARLLFKGSSMGMLVQLFRRAGMVPTFADDDEAASPEAALEHRLAAVELDGEEREALLAVLDEGAPLDFAGDDEPLIARASGKIARAALGIYARLHRGVSGKEGDAYFDLEPTKEEWTEAGRLAEKFNAGAVIIGHTHAARWKQEGDLVYANTGTWIGLMQLPRSDASEDEWIAYLHELKQNRRLDPKAQERIKIFTRFTAVMVDAHPDGGAALSLVEWKGGKLTPLGAGRVPPRGAR